MPLAHRIRIPGISASAQSDVDALDALGQQLDAVAVPLCVKSVSNMSNCNSCSWGSAANTNVWVIVH
jgi:hypothetical protein